MIDACGELRVAGFSSFTVFRVPGKKEEVFPCLGSFFQSEAWPAGWVQFRTFCALFGMGVFCHFDVSLFVFVRIRRSKGGQVPTFEKFF